MFNKSTIKIISLIMAMFMMFSSVSCGRADIGNTEDTSLHQDTSAPLNSTDSTTEPEETTAEPVDKTVRLTFIAAGDNIGHTNVYTDALNRATETSLEYNFVPMYNDIAPLIGNADIAFINQETMMADKSVSGGKYTGYPDFNSPQDMGRAIVDVGFDIVNIASNHMLDYGAAGLEGTIDFFDTQPVLQIGGYRNREDFENIRVYEQDGIKIAMLSFGFINYGKSLDRGSKLYIPDINNEEDILFQINAAKEVADLIFVSMHWDESNEGSFTTTAKQRRLAQLLADNGVDVVIGHHPHVLQEMKWVERDDGSRMLLIYSLGNLISTMLYGKYMVGGLATFNIIKEEGGEPYIDSPMLIPTITHFNMSRRGLQVYQLENYSEELAASHGCLADDPGFTYDKAIKYVTNTISKEFLPDFYQDK
ncbi:MAG: CapA family protein [Clostridia bacterium]|nr:CapA family protein [Clostridia bacterium]